MGSGACGGLVLGPQCKHGHWRQCPIPGPCFCFQVLRSQGVEMGAWTDALWDVSQHPPYEAAPPPSCLSLQSSCGSSSVKCSVVYGLAGRGAQHELGQLDITGLEGF